MAISRAYLSHIKRRNQQRGAALFLVVMVISLITAVGVFSMRSASLTNIAAGFNRQGIQTVMLARLATRAAASYADEHPDDVTARKKVANCAAKYLAADTSGQAFCTALTGTLMEDYFFTVDDGLSGLLSVQDGTGTGISASMSAELTGNYANLPPKGSDQSSGSTVNIAVAVTGRAQVFPFDPTTTGICAAGAQNSIVEHTIRAHISVPTDG